MTYDPRSSRIKLIAMWVTWSHQKHKGSESEHTDSVSKSGNKPSQAIAAPPEEGQSPESFLAELSPKTPLTPVIDSPTILNHPLEYGQDLEELDNGPLALMDTCNDHPSLPQGNQKYYWNFSWSSYLLS